jgi:hypothetical protein
VCCVWLNKLLYHVTRVGITEGTRNVWPIEEKGMQWRIWCRRPTSTGPLPNCQWKWTMTTGPLSHSRTASTSGLWHLDHWATRELLVHNTVPQPVYTSTVLYTFKEGVTVNLHIYYVNCSSVLNIKHKKLTLLPSIHIGIPVDSSYSTTDARARWMDNYTPRPL